MLLEQWLSVMFRPIQRRVPLKIVFQSEILSDQDCLAIFFDHMEVI